jgi:hypothetical protein
MSEEQEKKQSDYQKAPEVPEEVRPLYEAVKAVLANQLSVTEAAVKVGLSRNRFQTLMHRGLHGLMEGVSPRAQGRKAKPVREAELEAELEQLKKENARLKARVDTVDRLLGLASDLVKGKVQLKGRARQAGAEAGRETDSNESDEPDGEARARLEGFRALRALGLELVLASALIGTSPSTARRHAAREREGLPLVQRRGPSPQSPSAELELAGERVVREMNGLIGADALSHRVPGLSRRTAAAVKSGTVTAMERERVDGCERMRVTEPGVIRGFDAMHVSTTAGTYFALIAADASVPYRTVMQLYEQYDTRAVVDALERDFLINGAPLVLRLDRAKCHQTGEVRELCDSWGVLLLHGPPRHPQYYGQLERQNREHRAWLHACPVLAPEELEHELERMQYAWNSSLPRRSLAWRTASEAWWQRTKLEVDREELKTEVEDRAARIQRQLEVRGGTADMSERFAIEAALMQRGWLERRSGARC